MAGIGAVSMMIGSPPASTAVWIRAIGVRPSSAAFSLVVISSAADPSEICEELPAVITPPSGLKTVLSAPRVSSVLPRLMPSSLEITVPSSSVTGAICPSNRPSSWAAAARSWLDRENSSTWAREKPHCSAIISAPTPWFGKTPW